jgi:UDP-N-acetylglucosamine--N-acetylmuramyl-(pentapeptide) pyrophosphoryl-undecaprenol N-acetylglucosamine transferase
MGKGIILLSAGGTGGHLFPAEALAHELAARGWEVHLATDSRAERFAARFPAVAIHPIPSATIGSKNPLKLLRSFWTLWSGVRQAGALIARLRPKAVIGFGGYPTLPPLFAATRRGVPTLIHEQNAVMGRANKALAARVTAIAGGFLNPSASSHAAKITVTGNPVRPAVIEAAQNAYAPSAGGDPFRLLVFGGSQGAQFFSEAIPPAVAALPEAVRKRLRVTQQARSEDEAKVRGAYREMGIEAEISPFFTDMAERIAAAHLVISRSGASTVSEIAVIGRPALLVPYPHALDHDQAANAAALAAAGGAEVHQQNTLSTEKLTALIEGVVFNPQRLSAMAAAAKSAGRPDATRLLADLAEAIAEGRAVKATSQGTRQ